MSHVANCPLGLTVGPTGPDGPLSPVVPGYPVNPWKPCTLETDGLVEQQIRQRDLESELPVPEANVRIHREIKRTGHSRILTVNEVVQRVECE